MWAQVCDDTRTLLKVTALLWAGFTSACSYLQCVTGPRLLTRHKLSCCARHQPQQTAGTTPMKQHWKLNSPCTSNDTLCCKHILLPHACANNHPAQAAVGFMPRTKGCLHPGKQLFARVHLRHACMNMQMQHYWAGRCECAPAWLLITMAMRHSL